ncbi:MAG: hypothetical protein HEQ13_04860 [Dolichospermum sp. DEX189]|jgi:hypothetical protein|uniref:Uncharacterized protein n=1 Tax=Aphanizomenon flos-aquae WA102 TaxID=1710896 RepID=A0A1B7X4R2_APHFL|nr:hypothetical protein [Aphanizomenon flos-aquae Clear-A1]MBO1068740.1 hypothetical protein [Dolichospermum sp. DEX189]OBQ20094.1 MAG: hypothetical protein AN488_13490 [Anabaena sp. WA113]OBQ44356.1 MAG: hypothetical protein AN484_07425 [Aphanizomenon flos-aquae WA102]
MESNQVDIEGIINAGSPPAKQDEQDRSAREVRFQMVIPPEMCKLIDNARKLTKTSRRAWLLQAAQEKLERQGKL